MKGDPISWRDLQYATALDEKLLNFALYELIDAKQVLKVGKKYEVPKKLYQDYQKSLGSIKN